MALYEWNSQLDSFNKRKVTRKPFDGMTSLLWYNCNNVQCQFRLWSASFSAKYAAQTPRSPCMVIFETRYTLLWLHKQFNTTYMSRGCLVNLGRFHTLQLSNMMTSRCGTVFLYYSPFVSPVNSPLKEPLMRISADPIFANINRIYTREYIDWYTMQITCYYMKTWSKQFIGNMLYIKTYRKIKLCFLKI